MAIIDDLEDCIRKEISTDKNIDIEKDEDLIGLGIIDSLAIMKLVDCLERMYGIKVLDEEIVPENFQTLNSIDEYVKSKLSKK